MNKIGIIIAREYLSRVRKKSFIVMTILGPLLFGLFFIFVGWTATKGIETKSILVVDESGVFAKTFKDSKEITYSFTGKTLDDSKEQVIGGAFDGLLYIPKIDIDAPEGVVFYASGNPSISLVNGLSKKIEEQIENIKLVRSGIDQEVLDGLKSNVNIGTINLEETGKETESNSITASVIGYASSFMIYMFIFIYGAMCMRGVVEEKTSRIIEVVIASVKPFQLMMGKVIGIAGVGLSQFILWILLTVGISSVAGGFFAKGLAEKQQTGLEEIVQESEIQQDTMDAGMLSEVTKALETVNFPLVVFSFVFFFFTGYLLYGALFAAVGSAVDNDADTQQFMFPITIPLIVSIVMLSVVINDPNSSLAFWMSVIPFTSPVVMMMRVPFGVPTWQLILSMVLMVAGFIFTIWVASRIYRIGILMHGTKVNYRVLARWFMQKN